MKVLSLTQPWATLVAIGAKRVETRSWNTNYLMKPLLIHASKTFPLWAKSLVHDPAFFESLRSHPDFVGLTSPQIVQALPLGAVVCQCRVFGTRTTQMVRDGLASGHSWYKAVFTEKELEFGDYSLGRWAWILEAIKKFEVPVPAKGALGLWEWPLEAPIPQLWKTEISDSAATPGQGETEKGAV